MPIMDGYETCRQLRQRFPTIKILAYSTDGHPMIIEKIKTSGAPGFIRKMDAFHGLKDAIFNLLAE